jgi:hypothetical protein
MRTPILLLIPVIAFFMGCSSPYVVGTPIEKAKVVQIVPGTTDEAKIVEMFGPPEKKEMIGAGETKYVYGYFYQEPKVWTKSIQHKTSLEVLMKDGVVQKYEYKKQAIDPESSTGR